MISAKEKTVSSVVGRSVCVLALPINETNTMLNTLIASRDPIPPDLLRVFSFPSVRLYRLLRPADKPHDRGSRVRSKTSEEFVIILLA
tara:strand:- start:248 stop:511 length:264 start_codon:yes stop_codon:yes gene_type:complete